MKAPALWLGAALLLSACGDEAPQQPPPPDTTEAVETVSIGQAAEPLATISFGELDLDPITPRQIRNIAALEVTNTPDCNAPATRPQPGSALWQYRDKVNRYCAILGSLDLYRNAAVHTAWQRSQAARAEADPDGEAGSYTGDPFREPLSRWHGERGRYSSVSYTQTVGDEAPFTRHAAIFRPLAACSGEGTAECPEGLPTVDGPPWPGVMLVCHWCSLDQSGENGHSHGREAADVYIWAAQLLAEAGYMVMTAPVFGEAETGQGLDYFLSTAEQPGADGDVNPYWEELDRQRIGMTGHSGAGSRSLENGQGDDRVRAIVSWDRSRSFDPRALDITTPTLFWTGDVDYFYHDGIVPTEQPLPPPEPGSKWADLALFREAQVPGMLVAIGSATHGEPQRSTTVIDEPDGRRVGDCRVCSRHGRAISAYYTLAWFDHFLKGDGNAAMAEDAMQRLTATRFDDSVDRHAIGMGRFDRQRAGEAGDLEAGNIPVTIEGLSVVDALSFYRRSAWYFGEAADQRCDDMQQGLALGRC